MATAVDDFLQDWDERLSSPQARLLVERLIELYGDRHVLPEGEDESLRRCCPYRGQCWNGVPPPDDPEHAGISIPWIGRRYPKTRVVLVGMNFNNHGGIGAHYHVCEDHIASMEAGESGKNGEAFARGAMRALQVILNEGERDEFEPAEPLNTDLAGLWESCAYLQAIKCSPGSAASEPTGSMFNLCPLYLLRDELEILEPNVIVVFGRSKLRDVIRPWAVSPDGYDIEEGPKLERNKARLGGREVELFSLNHPSSRNSNDFNGSIEQLYSSLQGAPL